MNTGSIFPKSGKMIQVPAATGPKINLYSTTFGIGVESGETSDASRRARSASAPTPATARTSATSTPTRAAASSSTVTLATPATPPTDSGSVQLRIPIAPRQQPDRLLRDDLQHADQLPERQPPHQGDGPTQGQPWRRVAHLHQVLRAGNVVDEARRDGRHHRSCRLRQQRGVWNQFRGRC